MKITIYELLGLIKNGKAPKKIKHNDKVYIYYDFVQGYYEDGFAGIYNKKFLTFRNEQYSKVLNEEVEIIEEEKEIEKIELLKIYQEYLESNFTVQMTNIFSDIETMFNELIDEINKLKRDKE